MKNRLPVLILASVFAVVCCLSCDKDTDIRDLDPAIISPQIIRLIEAEQAGEVDEYAEPRRIDIIDGKVQLTIFCLPGESENVAEEAADYGEIQISTYDTIDIWILISEISCLQDIEGINTIKFIEHPTLDQ